MLKLPRALSLRTKLVLLSLIVEVGMLSLLVVNSVRLSQDSLIAQAQVRYMELNTLFNAALAAPLAQRDYATLHEILAESVHEEGIVYAVLVDRAGHIAASSGWQKGRTLPVVTPPTFADSQAKQFDANTQILLAGQGYGTLYYGVSTTFLSEARAHLVRQSLLIAGAEIFLSTLLLAGLGYWLTRHLVKLTRATEAFAQGRLDIRLPVVSNDEVGSLTGAFNAMANAIAAQIDALKTSTASLHEEQARLVALLHAMKLGILFADTNNRILYYNPAFQAIWRLPAGRSLHGMLPVEAISASDSAALAAPDQLGELMREPAGAHDDRPASQICLTDGRLVTRLSHPVYDSASAFIGHLWMFEDVTQEQQTAQQLIYLAERDALTGLFNRHRLHEEMEKLLAESARAGTQGALLFFDLDEFKYINDTFGHQAGDATLTRIATELSAQVRRNEVLARLGGDEFALLIPQITDLKEVEILAERVVRAIAQLPFVFSDKPLRVTVSLGVALYPQHGATIEDLIAHADTAMYQAKACGKNTWQVYRPELDMGKEMVARLAWNERLSQAFEKNLFRLHFQGVYHTVDRSLSHLEALVRMIDEENPGQLVMPGLFIPIAEKTGKILELDRWVVNEAIATLARHPKLRAMAVNLSGRSLADPSLPQYIQDMLLLHAVDPGRLVVEITETTAIGDLQDAARFIEALHRAGCDTCLDDFGTGFSSFAYLKYLKVGAIKIDGLFIRDLPNDHDNQLFVKSIADVARGMGKVTVAEFVEDEATLKLLTQFGVDLLQGYFLDRPVADHPGLQGNLSGQHEATHAADTHDLNAAA